MEGLSDNLKRTYRQFSGGLGKRILDRYYLKNLSASLAKVNALIAELDNHLLPIYTFLLDLRSVIERGVQKKSQVESGILFKLVTAFPHLDPERIIQDIALLQSSNLPEMEIALRLFQAYRVESDNSSRIEYQTGYPKGDELLNNLARSLKHKLTNYDKREFGVFLSVLADVIHYAYEAETQPKQFFPLLYDATATKEAPFQEDIFKWLKRGPRAVYYNYETSDLIGGGRIDIIYREQGFVFPIEIKRDYTPPTWEGISANYLAQAQTYTLPYSQLGILVIFEISEKKGHSPINDFQDRFEILHLSPLYPIAEKHPDFIIACIIPGNKTSPSGYTSYSAK